MKKIAALLFSHCFLFILSAQDATVKTYVRKPELGISFIFNDYATAQNIHRTSFSSVLINKQTTKLKEMAPGVALTYFQGLTNHMDFAGTLAASFVKYDASGANAGSKERFLLEGDASVHFKLISEKYLVTPYASLGVGFSKFGVYYGAFTPVGLGMQIKLADQTHVFLNSSYRIPVISNTSDYHFMHSIGIAGAIGGN